MLRQKLKPKLTEFKKNTKQTKREERKLLMPKELLKMLPMLLLKRLSIRLKKLEKLKKTNNLLILPRKWKKESPNSKKSTNTSG